VSDAIDETPAGAIRSFFGALAFILLMVGMEGLAGGGHSGLFYALLCIFALPCFLAAVFWKQAKRRLSKETQEDLVKFGQSQVTRFGMVALVLQTLILFPVAYLAFSYLADRAVSAEVATLKDVQNQTNQKLQAEKVLADKWRFGDMLRRANLNCKYQLELSPKAFETP
jgi:hypothetical protein